MRVTDRRFLEQILHKANALRRRRFLEEDAVMRPLEVPFLAEYIEEKGIGPSTGSDHRFH